jgi:hypothetical protein
MTETNAPTYILPGTWGRVDLASDASTASSIRKVVEHAVGRDDRLASLRADLRGRLRTAADAARAAQAVEFRVALELAPGVPLPAWLAVFLPSIDSTDFRALGLDQLEVALQGGLAAAPSAAAGSDTRQVVKGTHVHAVRQAFRRVQPATPDVPEIDVLQVDYWLAATDPNRLALFTFSTNLVELEERMLEFFDAIIGTLRWRPQVQPA